MAIADKLNKILESKAAIKAAIEAKGVTDVGDVLADYPDKIASIQNQSSESWKEDSWWDIESIVQQPENQIEKYPYKTIQLLISYSASDTFSGANAYKTSDGKFYETDEEVTHQWDMSQDKPCMEDGLETYSTRWVISYYTEEYGAINPILQSVLYYIADGYKISSGNFQNSRVLKAVKVINGGSFAENTYQNVLRSCTYIEEFPLEILKVPNNVFNDTSIKKIADINTGTPWNVIDGSEVKKVKFTENVLGFGAAYFQNSRFLGRIDFSENANLGKDFKCPDTPLSRNNLLYLINRLPEITSTQTFNIGANNLEKLTDEEKAIATNKGWTLA